MCSWQIAVTLLVSGVYSTSLKGNPNPTPSDALERYNRPDTSKSRCLEILLTDSRRLILPLQESHDNLLYRCIVPRIAESDRKPPPCVMRSTLLTTSYSPKRLKPPSV